MSEFGERESESPDGPEYVCLDHLQKLRACFRCHLVKSQNQFRDAGCDNCPFFKAKRYTYIEYTSQNFEGLVSVLDPGVSWVALHLGITQFVPGTYCRRIRDEISEEMLDDFRKLGIGMAKNPN